MEAISLDGPTVMNLIGGGIAHAKTLGHVPTGVQLGPTVYGILVRLRTTLPDPPKIESVFGLPVSINVLEGSSLIRILVKP